MYRLSYLPLARQDIFEIVLYVSEHLKNEKAATELVDRLDKSVARLKQFPFSCKIFQASMSLEEEYRSLLVKNYMVFYVVRGDIVEIHRVIYSKMDIVSVIKE
ncbi:MAG: type II toxin-antitoxin system RelE/ParE family toxin [Alkaliphilus sp.]